MNLYEGVNTLLGAIGEIPITDNTSAMEADATSDVGMARDALLSMSRSIQEQGFWFNKEKAYPLVPNTDGYIPIGNNILSVYSPTLIVKDHKLYNTETRSYLFEDTQDVDIIFNLQFDDLPNVAADAIVREASTEFYNNILGDTQELRILQTNAEKAQVSLQKAQAKHRKTNLIAGSRLITRSTNPTGVR